MVKRVLQTVTVLLLFILTYVGVAVAAPPAHAGGPDKTGPPGQEKKANVEAVEEEQETVQNQVYERNGEKEKSLPPGLQGKGIPPGLQDKGGLPPGMQGRDELPPGIQMRFVEALEQQEQAGLKISGDGLIVIPSEETLTTDYEAVFVDEDGEERTVQVDWTFDNENDLDGVSFDEGTLEVTGGAEPGVVTLNASYSTEEETFTEELKVEIAEPEVHEIEIVGDNYLAFEEGQEDMIEADYTAKVLDQTGSIMEEETVEWNVESEQEVISVEENEGLNAAVYPEEGEFTVTAQNGDVTADMTVKVYVPEVSALEISGPEYVALDTVEEVPYTMTYTAIAKDQAGQDMEEEDVTWSLESDYSGIELDEGEVVLTELPDEEIVFTLKAESEEDGELYDELQVPLYYPEATDVSVEGEQSLAIPDEGEITEEYEAVVIDQYGKKMQGEDIEWYLADEDGETLEVDGVELENGSLIIKSEDGENFLWLWTGVLTVTAEAGEGSIWLWAVNSEDVFGEYEVELD